MTFFPKTDFTIWLRENNESKPNVILSGNLLDMYKRQCLSVCHLIYLSACSVVVQLSHVLTWKAADIAPIVQTSPLSNVMKFFQSRATRLYSPLCWSIRPSVCLSFHPSMGVFCSLLKMIGFEKILSNAEWDRQKITLVYNIVAILVVGAHNPPFTHWHISHSKNRSKLFE